MQASQGYIVPYSVSDQLRLLRARTETERECRYMQLLLLLLLTDGYAQCLQHSLSRPPSSMDILDETKEYSWTFQIYRRLDCD